MEADSSLTETIQTASPGMRERGIHLCIPSLLALLQAVFSFCVYTPSASNRMAYFVSRHKSIIKTAAQTVRLSIAALHFGAF
jgi:hypothetical protein